MTGFARLARYSDVIFFALVVALTFSFSVEVPASDDWDFMPIIQNMKAGTLDWAALNAPYAGHKITVTYLVIGGVAFLTHWNTYVFRALNLALFLGAWLAIRRAAVEEGHLIAAALLFWSWDQWVAFLWTIMISCTMAVFCTLWCLRLLARGGSRRFVAAMALAVIGTFCHGAGLAVWPAAFYLLFFTPRPIAQRVAFIAVLAAALVMFLYHPPGHAGLMASNLHPPAATPRWKVYLGMLFYGLQAMGAPLAFARMGSAAMASVCGLLILFSGGAWSKSKARPFSAALLLAALGMIFLIMVARGGGASAGQATDTRYGTIAMLFWVALVLLVDWSGWRRYALVFLVALCAVRSLSRLPSMINYRKVQEQEARGLLEWSANRFALEGAHTTPAQFDEDERLMRQWHYSLFRDRQDKAAPAPQPLQTPE